MIKEAIEKILDLAIPTTYQFEGRRYASKALVPVMEPNIALHKVGTLKGFVDLIKRLEGKDFDAQKVFVHVTGPTHVMLCTELIEPWKTRTTLITASPVGLPVFAFNQKLTPEEFIIALQVHFVKNAARDDLMAMMSSVSGEAVRTAIDDGISQTVACKSGALLAERKAPNPVLLAPWRTFQEVKQPESPFVFRLHQDAAGAIPRAALYEADGGAWTREAMENVALWLKFELPDYKVIF